MRIPKIAADEFAVFARVTISPADYDDLPDGIKAMCSGAVISAERMASAYTGLPCERDAAAGDTDADPNDDLKYAVLVTAAEMYDNRQIVTQYQTRNPTVMQILNLHSTNLLPTPELYEEEAAAG